MHIINYEKLECVDFATKYLPNCDLTIKVQIDRDNKYKLEPEGYYYLVTYESTIEIFGFDKTGCMYGILDLSDYLGMDVDVKTLDGLKKVPYIKKRGLKLNIPLDSRTPSFSDASDSARMNIENMWDIKYWEEFLDEMAINHYNVLTLWSLNPFPSMVDVPEYPLISLYDIKVSNCTVVQDDLKGMGMSNADTLASLVTVKKMTIKDKVLFWKEVMEYADRRGIGIYIFTWNIFVYGTENTPYGITVDMNNEVTIDYFRKSVRAMVSTYPLLMGIGITAGEQMPGTHLENELWLYKTYGQGINDALEGVSDRNFTLIHRVHMTELEIVNKIFRGLKCKLELSFKYSQAHVYVNTRPHFGDEFFKEVRKTGNKVWLTLRNDDFYMNRWSSPTFIRDYILNIPQDVVDGFYYGSDGYTPARDYLSKNEKIRGMLDIKRQFMMYKGWGLLSFDPYTDFYRFQYILKKRLGIPDSSKLMEVWEAVSRNICLVQCTHFHELDFQYYVESNTSLDSVRNRLKRVVMFRDINEFINCKAVPGTDYISIKDYCMGRYCKGISPLDNAQNIIKNGKQAELFLQMNSLPKQNIELKEILNDIKNLMYLSYYYAHKIQAAVFLENFRLYGNIEDKKEAMQFIKLSFNDWKNYSSAISRQYNCQHFTRMSWVIDVSSFDYNAYLDIKIVENS